MDSRELIFNFCFELTIRPMLCIFHANSQVTLNYLPQVYQNKITLLKTGVDAERLVVRHRDFGWQF
ncbi:MAG: hypothetical protein PUP91_35550 [Rhizonema sp. PD37]|nr:hypothetical protein [Rhizonema sp. PD37]